MIVIEQTIDDNTGLPCWLIVDSVTTTVLDRAFDEADARDIADYYADMERDPYAHDDVFDYEDDQDWRDQF